MLRAGTERLCGCADTGIALQRAGRHALATAADAVSRLIFPARAVVSHLAESPDLGFGFTS